MACTSYFATALSALMVQTAEVLRPTGNKDRYGAVNADETTVAHRYPCRVMRDGTPQAPTVVGEKSIVRSDWRVLLPLTADIHSDDKIRVSGDVFEVLDTDEGRSGASFLTIFARRTT